MNAPKVGEIVGLKVARVYHTGNVLIEGSPNGGWDAVIHPDSLHPLPPSLTSEAQAVLDAAVEWHAAACRANSQVTSRLEAPLADAVWKYLATLPPPKPVDPIEAMAAAIWPWLRHGITGCEKYEWSVIRPGSLAYETTMDAAKAAVASARMGDGA